MNASIIDRAISQLREHRHTLYLNHDLIKRDYDVIGGMDGSSISREYGADFRMGLPNWVAQVFGTLSGKKGRTEQKDLSKSPELMALVLESHYELTGNLLELPDSAFSREAELIRYIGNGYITGPKESITAQSTGLSSELAKVVQAEREEQQRGFEDLDEDDPATVVWTAQGNPSLASIAHRKWVKPYSGTFVSSRRFVRGILGRFESETADIIFLSPRWIWATKPK